MSDKLSGTSTDGESLLSCERVSDELIEFRLHSPEALRVVHTEKAQLTREGDVLICPDALADMLSQVYELAHSRGESNGAANARHAFHRALGIDQLNNALVELGDAVRDLRR